MLKQYRDQIDQIDEQLISLLDKRFEITKQVGDYKRANNIAILNHDREQQIINKIVTSDAKHPQQIIDVYQAIMSISKGQQHE